MDEARLYNSLEGMDKELDAAYEAEIPFLDDPDPPFFTAGYPTILAELLEMTYSRRRKDKIEQGIREALYLEADAPLDENDRSLLMSAWGAHNYKLVARNVRKLAESVPHLEEFEWYVINQSNSQYSLDVLWKWKIIRDENGTVTLVNDDLTWAGCARGNPPPFPLFVGQEMAHNVEDSAGQYWT